jgi:hypothetical protein
MRPIQRRRYHVSHPTTYWRALQITKSTINLHQPYRITNRLRSRVEDLIVIIASVETPVQVRDFDSFDQFGLKPAVAVQCVFIAFKVGTSGGIIGLNEITCRITVVAWRGGYGGVVSR